MKKILFIVPNNVLNGTERYVLDLAVNLNKLGFESCVATPIIGPYSDILKENFINEFCYNNGRVLKFTLKGAFNLFNFIRKNNFDIIQSNNGLFGIVFGRIFGVKLCVESRQGLYFTEEQILKPGIKVKIAEFFKSKLVHFVLTGCENDAILLNKYFKFKKSKLKVFYNGLNFNELNKYRNLKLNYKIQDKRILIGNLGRLTFQKGQDRLINLIAEVYKKKKNIKLVIIGDGEEKNNLLKLIEKSELTGIVEILNYSQFYREELAKMDLLIMTSRYEGIPYVIMESMYIGTPVISTPVGGITEIIKDNINGFIISNDSITEYSEKLINIIENKQLLLEISKNAQNKINNYNIENMVRELKDFYLEALMYK